MYTNLHDCMYQILLHATTPLQTENIQQWTFSPFLSVELKSLSDNIYLIHLLFFLQVMTFWNNKKNNCALKVHHNTCMRKHLYTKIG